MDCCDVQNHDESNNLKSILKLNALNKEKSFNNLQLINFVDDYFKSSDIKSYDCDQDQVVNSADILSISKSRSTFFCYPCIACSSNFYYEQSLHLHLERRTVYIKVFCLKCNVSKTFFNRCKLIYHLYSHKNFLIEPIYKQITIDLIPVEKLVSNNKTKINLDNIDILDLTSDDLINLENFQVNLNKNDFNMFKCVICDALFFNTKELEEHYETGKRIYLASTGQKDLEESEYMDKFTSDSLAPYRQEGDNISRNVFLNHVENTATSLLSNDDLNKFSMQKLKFASRCSLIANLNLIFNKFSLYSNSLPVSETMMLVCPECGLYFNRDNLENFRNHLISQCFYSIKNFRIKCMKKNCDFICKTRKFAIDHWTQKHIKIVKYCDLCFKKGLKVNFIKENNNISVNEDHSNDTEDEMVNSQHDEINEKKIEKHFAEKHTEISSQNVKQYVKVVYKCECILPDECTFDTWKLCRKHYMQKLNKTINYINCFICDKNFNYIRYKQHLVAAHRIKDVIFCKECNGHVTDGSESLEEHLNSVHKNFKNSHLNLIHISYDEYLYQCFNCKLFFASTCNFSHNCMENDLKSNSSHTNYFSPIYIKFSSTRKLKDTEDDEKLIALERELHPTEKKENKISQNCPNHYEKVQSPDIIEIDFNEKDDGDANKKEKCEVCNKCFNDKDLYKRHIRSHGLYFLNVNGYLNGSNNQTVNLSKMAKS